MDNVPLDFQEILAILRGDPIQLPLFPEPAVVVYTAGLINALMEEKP